MNTCSFEIALLALSAHQQSAGAGTNVAQAMAWAMINRSTSEKTTLMEVIETVNRTGTADALLIPDQRDPAWGQTLRAIDAIYFADGATDPTNHGTVWVDMSLPSPVIPDEMEHTARVSQFSFFK